MRLARLTVLATLALTLLAAPLVAPGERAPRLPRVGVVYAHRMPAETWRSLPVVKAVLEGLEELQWVEGRDFVLDVRPATDFTHAQRRLRSLVAAKVDVLLFLGCNTEFHLARRLTHSIPIVVGSCVDDLIVTGIAPPGGNITGMSLLTPQMSAARLFLLKEIVPTLSRVTVLWSSERDFAQDWRELHAAAASIAVTLHSLEVRSRPDVLAHVLAREGQMGSLGSRMERTTCSHSTLPTYR